MSAEKQLGEQSPRRSFGYGKLVVLALFLLILIVAWVLLRDVLTLEHLAKQEGQLRQFHSDHRVITFGLAFVLYVVVTGLSLPGATIMTLTYGWFFGFWRAIILVSFASTAGATVAFLFSRYFFRASIQARFGDRLRGFNAALEKEGGFYLFTLRLIAGVPFFMINLVMGLTPIRAWTFWWVSQVGMLPGTAAYVYAGSTFPDLQTLSERGAAEILKPQVLVAFAILGLLPITVKKLLALLRSDDSHVQDKKNNGKPAPPCFKLGNDTPLDPQCFSVGRTQSEVGWICAPPGWVNPKPAGRYNLLVVGAGPAGLVAAAGAAGMGAKVALV